MADDELFSELSVQHSPKTFDGGRARLREPVRDQVELRAVELDALLGPDHPARLIWDYVSRIDLQVLEQKVRAREHTPGQAPASPRLLLALWLYATSEGIGSARALARLCVAHDAYRWLCGGVSVNYHGLADFRTAEPELLERLLSEHVATLSAAGVIDLDEITQDGVRVRACAGAASFRRRKTLHKELKKAQRRLAALRLELDDDPDASNRRIKAAQQRAAREREARVEAALDRLADGEEQTVAFFVDCGEINAAAVIELLQLSQLGEGIPVVAQELPEVIIFGGEFASNVGNEITGLLFGEKFSEGHDWGPIFGFGIRQR